MLLQLFAGSALVTLTVAIHSVVLGWMMWRLQQATVISRSVLSDAWLLGRIAIVCVLAHLSEITAWATFYWWWEVMPDPEIAAYFSAVTYATIGYGDVTPPNGWRLLAAMEGLTGILMCAWSGGFFFAVVRSLRESSPGAKPPA
ncbi:MAG: potassium channel family protein [Gammaproteobacteria bacterium]|nr:potassium channel family protein [Gammaproteobacteria bacterium]MDH4257134.1 potassium channel family protein [Gammaproteobacteria bacterium]MDH5312116.1 potassium channel family protein [Gammaproteobacteria bacterium]